MPVIVEIGGSTGGGVGTLVDQGMPTAPANAWPVEITDGSGTVIANPAHPVPVSFAAPSTSVVTSVAQSTSTITILSANPTRKGAIVFNNTTSGFLYVKLGASGTSVDFSYKMPPGGALELPFPAYTGVITGVWSTSGSGTAQVTELT